MTVSEKLFEQLCMIHQIRFEPIPTAQGQRTADYRIWLGAIETIVEVKEIDASEHEKQLLTSAGDEDAPAIISDIHLRIRNKFDKAKRQMRNLSGGRLPALLVLYDNTNGLSGMDNEAFMNAMHGDEVFAIESTREGKRQQIQRVFHTFSRKSRKVGKCYNRSVSALGRLLIDNTGNPILILFHNEYASNRLTNDEVKLIAVRQFVRPPLEQNEYRPWTEVRVS